MQTDVAIVGGGPAGARAAHTLARAGARVVVFDPSHPREKPCGGGVTGRALALVADVVDRAALPSTTIRRARFASDGNPVVALHGDALIVASRAAFDAALLASAEHAGARVERLRVRDVVVDGRGVRIETAHGSSAADFVIGADGATSLVRRRVAAAFSRAQLSIATGYFAHGVTSDEIVLSLIDDPPGYIWSFPRTDHLAIGICVQADAAVSVEALRARTREWIRTTAIAPRAQLTPYSWLIPSLRVRDFDALPLAGPRWSVVGDAGGLVDPITREGIFFALASGEYAAHALIDRQSTADYASRVHDEIVPELTRAARAKALFFRPAFTALLVRALRDSAAVRAVMADLIAGTQPYATLKWRLLKTFEFGLAWRAFIAQSSRRAL